MGRLKNYVPIDDEARQAIEEEDRELYRTDGTQRAEIKEGRNEFRFIPRKKGMRSHLKTVHVHFVNDVPGRDGVLAFNCPRKMLKPPKQCPECEYAKELYQSSNPVDQQQAKDHFPRAQTIANVIDRSREGDGPLVLAFGKVISESLKGILEDEGDYTNPTDGGFDIVIKRRGKKLDTRYTVTAARDSSPLSEDDDEAEEWIENQWSLVELSACLGSAAIRAALEGGDTRRADRQLPRGRSRTRTRTDDVRDDDDASKEGASRRRKRRSRAEDSPDIPPARGRRRSRRNIQDDVEDD